MNMLFAIPEILVLLISVIVLSLCVITAYTIYVDKKKTLFHNMMIIILIWLFWMIIANIIEILML